MEPVGFFANPNIHPYREWRHRLTTVEEYARAVRLDVRYERGYGLREFVRRAVAVGGEEDKAARCALCYEWRLRLAAQYAREHGFEAFTSTLLYSKYQNHALIQELGARAAKEHSVAFHYEDFREGWQAGIDRSLALGLYRQPYCGCVFSEEERYSKAWQRAHQQRRRDLT